MNEIQKTLYIPLYGKAYVSRKGLFLHDPMAEEIWEAEGFALKGKSKSKWLAYYMGMRCAVFDRWLQEQIRAEPSAVILHIGCGLDARCRRVASPGQLWFDIDFPQVMQERSRYYSETETYRMLGADIQSEGWLAQLPKGKAIVVMEGVSMYLPPEKLRRVLARLTAHFESVRLLMDCYTSFAAKASRFKNPINDVGVTKVWGLDDPKALEGDGLVCLGEHSMTPPGLVSRLQGLERSIFETLYAGGIAKKMYRLYEYGKEARHE